MISYRRGDDGLVSPDPAPPRGLTYRSCSRGPGPRNPASRAPNRQARDVGELDVRRPTHNGLHVGWLTGPGRLTGFRGAAVRLIRPHVVVFGAMLLAVGHGVAPAATAQERGGTAPATTPRAAYLQRGDEVEARYRGYRERLERFFEEFGAQLAAGAPE